MSSPDRESFLLSHSLTVVIFLTTVLSEGPPTAASAPSHIITLSFSWFDSPTPTVLTYLQLDFKKLEELHATFGIFESPHLSLNWCPFLEKY